MTKYVSTFDYRLRCALTVDQKTGVTIQGDGDTIAFGADGAQKVDRYNGYEETRAAGSGTEASRVRNLKLPDGLQMEPEPLPNGQSRIKLTKGGASWVSEPGSADQGWSFKGQSPLPGSNSSDSVVRLTHDGPKAFNDSSNDWDLSITSADGQRQAVYGRSGWQQTRGQEGNVRESLTLDARQNVVEQSWQEGQFSTTYSRAGLPGTPEVTTVKMPSGSIMSSPSRGVRINEGDQSVTAKSVVDAYDPSDSNRHGYAVELMNGATRTYWTDGQITGANLSEQPAS